MKSRIICFICLWIGNFIHSQDKITIRTDDYVTNQENFKKTGAEQLICPNIFKVEATSELLTESVFNYSPKNLKDVKFNTVWIADESSLGNGAKITFTFENIAEENWTNTNYFFFVNGYTYSDEIWKQYSRVKTFAIYLNGDFIQSLNIEDTQSLQWIELAIPLKNQDKITFEIIEFYQGSDYKNVAIAMLVPICLF